MSRRSERKAAARGGEVEVVDGMVRLDCSAGHPVGWLWRPHARDFIVVFDAARTSGRQAVEWPLRFTCLPCRFDGHQRDLRVSLERADALLTEVLEDRTRNTTVHVIDG